MTDQEIPPWLRALQKRAERASEHIDTAAAAAQNTVLRGAGAVAKESAKRTVGGIAGYLRQKAVSLADSAQARADALSLKPTDSQQTQHFAVAGSIAGRRIEEAVDAVRSAASSIAGRAKDAYDQYRAAQRRDALAPGMGGAADELLSSSVRPGTFRLVKALPGYTSFSATGTIEQVIVEYSRSDSRQDCELQTSGRITWGRDAAALERLPQAVDLLTDTLETLVGYDSYSTSNERVTGGESTYLLSADHTKGERTELSVALLERKKPALTLSISTAYVVRQCGATGDGITTGTALAAEQDNAQQNPQGKTH